MSTDRRTELEAQFCALLNDKLRGQAMMRAAHEQMLKIQGALEELARTPDALKGQ